MDMSPQIDQLAMALAKAQAAVEPAIKDKTNPAFRSKYADLASVWEACRKALTDNGLSVVQAPTNHAEGYAALRTMLLHTSGQWLATTVSARLVKDDAQGLGSAITYLRRYSLAAVVGVVADEDDDGNRATGAGSQASHQQRRDEPPPQQAGRGTTRGEGGIPRKEPASVAPGAEAAGTVINAKSRRVKDGTVLVVEFALAESGQQFVYYDAPADYAQLADGDTVTVKAGKPTKDGATYVNAVTDWQAPAGVATDEEIPF